jgi:orotidine-5'-phosphate decarboxylase
VTDHFSDRLADSIRARRSVVCVGLDPSLDRLPADLRDKHAAQAREIGAAAAVAACFEEFAGGIIAAVCDAAAAVKPQAAFFEQYGADGWRALAAVVRCAHDHDLPVIVDVKRNDIAATASAYAAALFGGAAGLGAESAGLGADAATVNPYLGEDSLQPFVDRCAEGKGIFVLARTSNPGAALLQEKEVDGRPLFLHVCESIARLGAGQRGAHGYSDVGAVAGATAPTALQAVRAALPDHFILIPGYGAQGGDAGALRGLASGDAAGFLVSASRSIIYAYEGGGGDYRSAAARAVAAMRDEIGVSW